MSDADQSRKAARQALLSRLGSTVQHAANNMLTVLTGTAEVLRRTAKDPRDLVRAERLLQATTRLEQLIRGYMTLARRPVPDDAPTDLGLLLARLGPVLELFVERGSVLEIDTPAGLPAVRLDASALDFALVDLVAGAGPHLGPKLKVSLSSAPGSVTLRFEGLPGEAPVAALLEVVRDAGGSVGRDDQTLALVFPRAGAT